MTVGHVCLEERWVQSGVSLEFKVEWGSAFRARWTATCSTKDTRRGMTVWSFIRTSTMQSLKDTVHINYWGHLHYSPGQSCTFFSPDCCMTCSLDHLLQPRLLHDLQSGSPPSAQTAAWPAVWITFFRPDCCMTCSLDHLQPRLLHHLQSGSPSSAQAAAWFEVWITFFSTGCCMIWGLDHLVQHRLLCNLQSGSPCSGKTAVRPTVWITLFRQDCCVTCSLDHLVQPRLLCNLQSVSPSSAQAGPRLLHDLQSGSPCSAQVAVRPAVWITLFSKGCCVICSLDQLVQPRLDQTWIRCLTSSLLPVHLLSAMIPTNLLLQEFLDFPNDLRWCMLQPCLGLLQSRAKHDLHPPRMAKCKRSILQFPHPARAQLGIFC